MKQEKNKMSDYYVRDFNFDRCDTCLHRDNDCNDCGVNWCEICIHKK